MDGASEGQQKIQTSIHNYQNLLSKQIQFKLGKIPVATNCNALATICDTTGRFLKRIMHGTAYMQPTVGALERYNVTLNNVIETLEFVALIANTAPEKLSDCSFIDEHFTLYRWYAPDDRYETRFPPGHCTFPGCLRITHYTIAKLYGSTHKTKEHVLPLYEKPLDEKNKKPADILKHTSDYIRFNYGLQSIMHGELNKEQAIKKPFAWVLPKEYKDLVRQGSCMLIFSDGTQMMVEVTAHNGMKGDQSYWYCAPVANALPNGKKYHHKVRPIPGVSFAGDIKNIGFGKLLCTIGVNQATGKREAHLGVLMDTGTAFKNNPYHLDLFMGYFEEPLHFQAHSKKFPVSGQVYILIKK